MYIRTVGLIIPAFRYVRTRRFAAKAVYVGPGNCFNPHEAPYPPSGWIGNVIAVFQVVPLRIGNNRITEAAGFQGHQRVFIAPHPVDGVQVFGADGRIRLEPDITVRFQKGKDVVLIPPHGFPVLLDAEALCKLEAIGYQTLQARKSPEENSLCFGF